MDTWDNASGMNQKNIYTWEKHIADQYSYTPALPRHTKHMAIDGQVCFYRWLFADHVKPWKCTTKPVKPVNSIIKNVSGAKMLPTTVLAYHQPVDCVCFCHPLKTQHCYLGTNGKYNLPLTTHSPPVPTPSLKSHSLPYSWQYSGCAQNSTVLAS